MCTVRRAATASSIGRKAGPPTTRTLAHAYQPIPPTYSLHATTSSRGPPVRPATALGIVLPVGAGSATIGLFTPSSYGRPSMERPPVGVWAAERLRHLGASLRP